MGDRLCRLVGAKASLLAGVCALMLCICANPTTATADEIYRFRAGVHISREHPPTDKQLQALLKGLRYWTGFTEVAVDGADHVIPGDRTRIAGGSATARELFLGAIDSRDSFTIESRDRSPNIAFAQIEPVVDFVDGKGYRHAVWLVRIDFSDFTQLRGDSECLASFDPTINMLHEIAHGVLKLHDTISAGDQLGECERYINLIRSELGLPERVHYFPRNRWAPTKGGHLDELEGEVIFLSHSGQSEKTTALPITFNLQRVCAVRKLDSSSGHTATLIGWSRH